MNGRLAKEQRRNLKREVGEVAANAVSELRELVLQVHNEHKVLARSMAEFEKDLAKTRERLLVVDATAGVEREKLESLTARFDGMCASVEMLDRAQARDFMFADRRLEALERPWWRKLLDRVRPQTTAPADAAA